MNPRHSGRRYSDLLYKMVAIIGMAAAVGMAALITAWVAGDARAAGVPTSTVEVGPITICVDGDCVTQKDPQSTSATVPPPNVAGALVCAYGSITGATECRAVPVASGGFGYVPPGWSGPGTPPPSVSMPPNLGLGAIYWISWAFNSPSNQSRTSKQSSWASVCTALNASFCAANPTQTTCYVGPGSSNLGCSTCSCAGASCTPTCSAKWAGYSFSVLWCPAGEMPLVSNPTVCTGVQNACDIPTGYAQTAAGGQCVVQSNGPSVVPRPADGKCNIVRTGNSYAGEALDPDCAVAGVTPVGAYVPLGASVVGQKTEDGVTTKGEATATAQGTTLKASTEDGVTGRVEAHTVTVGPGGAGGGAVTGHSETTGTGSGLGVVNDQNVNVKAGGGGEAGEIEFPEIPDDYNRETTQQAILDKLTAAPADLDGAVDSLDDAAAARISAFDGATGAHGITLSFSPVLPSPSCSFPTFTVAGHTLDMSTWCPRVEILRQLIGLALYIATAFALYDIFTRTSGA